MRPHLCLVAFVALFSAWSPAFASDDYSAESEAIYNALHVQEDLLVRGVNSLRYVKEVGRLSCNKVITKADNVVVGYVCTLTESEADDYSIEDEQLFNALAVDEQYAELGANSVRYEKAIGGLVCTRVVTKIDEVTVGVTCRK